MSAINKSSFQFLKKLQKNNTREWFAENKLTYQTALDNVKSFKDDLEMEMNSHDHIEKAKLFRIYRDVRFSKDKTPYKNSFSGSFTRATAKLRGGYYWHLEPENTMIACGFWNPESKDLKLIRDHIAAEDAPLRKVLKNKKLKEYWGEIQGDKVKSAPKGFDKNHSAIDLLRHKQFIFVKNFTDAEALDPNFHKVIATHFQGIRPFFNYMSEILTHDLNGVSLLPEK